MPSFLFGSKVGCVGQTRLALASLSRYRTPRGLQRGAGFTLLEVLLSIALIALVGTVLIGGSAHLMSDQPLTPHDVFWQAVREARKSALKSEREVRLKFDKDKKQFLLIDGTAPAQLAADGFTRVEAPLKQIPIRMAAGTDLTIEFLAPATKGSGSTILVGGVMIESQTVPYVTFYSDGTCSPFRTQFVRSGSSSVLNIDPWTCAPVLTPNDPNAPPSS